MTIFPKSFSKFEKDLTFFKSLIEDSRGSTAFLMMLASERALVQPVIHEMKLLKFFSFAILKSMRQSHLSDLLRTI